MSDLTKESGDSREEAFHASLSSMTLTELQDVFGHLDRDKYPERIEAVRSQMQDRIDQLSNLGPANVSQDGAGVFRRLWGSLLDVFISLFPLILYFGLSKLAASGGTGGRGGRGRGGGGRGGRGRGRGTQEEESLIDQVIDFVTSPEALLDVAATYGPYVLAFVAYRALYSLPQMVRSGSLPGMKEAGVRVTVDGDSQMTYSRAAMRFGAAYVLGILTLGISHLWALWDRSGRTLFDRVAGTRAVRCDRQREKAPERRLFED